MRVSKEMKTTLNKIRKYEPCTDGWQKLLTHLGKTKADDEPLSLLTIIDSNGLDDALWCLRAVEGHAKEIRLYAVWCARQVQHLLKDQRSLDALDMAERYANGQATEAELTAVRDAAWDAAWDARSAAWAAKAARSAWATEAAAWAAEAAVLADGSAWAAKAARSARDAAEAAAWEAAAWKDARSARDAAWVEMKQRQEAELRRICGEIV